MNPRSPIKVEPRERVTTYLALLSSDRSREVLSRWIDSERLAFELCRLWFDEIYVPGISYFDGLKGDYSEEAALTFQNAFDEDELAALERFHRFFELRVEMLRHQIRSAGRFPETDLWRNLVKDAGYLLENLDPNAVRRRKRLHEYLESVESPPALDRLLLTSTPPEGAGPGK